MKTHLLTITILLAMLGFTACQHEASVPVCPENSSLENKICVCDHGYSGHLCTVGDSCLLNDVQCENDGVCIDGHCECTHLYGGASCNEYRPDDLIGQFEIVDFQFENNEQTCHKRILLDFDILGPRIEPSGTFSYHVKDGSLIIRTGGDVYLDEREENTGSEDLKFRMYTHIHQYGYMNFQFDCQYHNDSIVGKGIVYKLPWLRGGPGETKSCIEEATFVAIRAE